MANYIDGFVIPIRTTKVADYRRIARLARKVWMEHGALQYFECVGDDLDIEKVVSFKKLAKAKPGETVLFSWIAYRSKAHRNAVNKKVMADPRIAKMMNGPSPIDMRRMAYGGFKVLVR